MTVIVHSILQHSENIELFSGLMSRQDLSDDKAFAVVLLVRALAMLSLTHPTDVPIGFVSLPVSIYTRKYNFPNCIFTILKLIIMLDVKPDFETRNHSPKDKMQTQTC